MRVRRAPRVRALVLGSLLGGIVLLGGCDSEEPPTSGPTPTPSSTTSSTSPSPPATPTPTPSETSTIPAAARKNTPEGAEAFVRYFVNQSAQAWMEGDADLVESLSDADCESCAELAARADQLKQAGQHYAAAPITVTKVRALTGDESRINVAASIRQRRVDVVDEGGEVVSSDGADELRRTFLLYWKGDQWVVGGIA